MSRALEANEIGLTLDIAKALRPFLSQEDNREALRHVYITTEVFVASDGQSLIEQQVHHSERGPISHGWEPKLLPCEYLTVIRKKSEMLVVNLHTGSVEVRGLGPLYPIRLPEVSNKTASGQEYPRYLKLLEVAETGHHVATLGINPLLVARAMAVRKTEAPLVLRIPPNTVGSDYIATGVLFEVPTEGIRGLLMPMRVRS